MSAEATTDNTSVRVLWQWSQEGIPMCVGSVQIHYQPTEGGSLLMYTVSNTTATSGTLPNLQCNTKYTVWVYVSGGPTSKRSVSRMVSLPARGICIVSELHAFSLHSFVVIYTTYNAKQSALSGLVYVEKD